MAAQSFTRNYRDHSNDHGYQFEFSCDKCGSGFRSSFETSTLGLAASVIKAAGAFLGGSMYRAGWGADQLKDAFRGPAWDRAFQNAIEECRPKFRQCTLCGTWVCAQVCWNAERGLCEGCAPNLAEHAPALQASAAVQQARQKIAEVDQTRGADVSGAAPALRTCSKCQASLPAAARFCAHCGSAAAPAASAFCTGCGGSLTPGARFCSGCGAVAPSS